MTPLLSVIIITKNEEHNIEDCLKSVDWADEIVVVDSGSTDETVKICKAYTDKILVTDWPGYGLQKQRALEMATGEWVLSLDADERVTPALKQEILRVLPSTSCDGFELLFLSEYCGKKIRFGDWWNDRSLCLFRRTKGYFVPSIIHEELKVQGTIGRLKGHVDHLSLPDLSVVLKKLNEYSTLGAFQAHQRHKKCGLFMAIMRGLFTFIRGYILRLGFLDGREGFLLAVSNAEGTYYKYVKLMYLNRTKS